MKQASTLLAAAILHSSWCSAAEPTLVPVIQVEWINVDQPQPHAFPGPDSPRFKTGKKYDDWQVARRSNDSRCPPADVFSPATLQHDSGLH